MIKSAKLQIMWASVILITVLVLGFLGVYALQKSMTIKMGFNVEPNVRCVIEAQIDGGNYEEIFSNLSNNSSISPNWMLDTTHSSLIYRNNLSTMLGTPINFKIHNYTTKSIYVESIISGVTYDSKVVDALAEPRATASVEEVSAQIIDNSSTSFSLKFTQVNKITIGSPTIEFDMDYAQNTVKQAQNGYCVPIGEDLKAQLVSTLNQPILINTILINSQTPIYTFEEDALGNENILTISSGNIIGDIIISNKQIYNITTNFTGVQFDTTYEDRTIINSGGNYYIPAGDNLEAKLVATDTNACPDVYGLTINSASMMTVDNDDSTIIDCQYYNYLTQTLTLPSALINGDIDLTSSIYWDGNATSSYAGGTGTQSDPYIITTPKHFAHMQKITTTNALAQDNTSGKYFELNNDLYFSSYNFEHDEASGTIKVISILDNQVKCVIGTGNKGKNYNTSTAPIIDQAYSTSALLNTGDISTMTTNLPLDFKRFGGIAYFNGNINGNNNEIYGMKCLYFFGSISATISDLTFNSCLAISSTTYCALLFYTLYDSTLINNCNVLNSTLCADGFLGPVGGTFNKTGSYMINCLSINNKIIGVSERTTNQRCFGGLVGECYNGNMINCANYSYVYGDCEIGGITGRLETGVLENCFNAGSVFCTGFNSKKQYTGAIAGGYSTASCSTAVYASNHYINGSATENGVINRNAVFSEVVASCTAYDNVGTALAPNCTDAVKNQILNNLNAYVTNNPTVTYNGQTYNLQTWTRDTNNIINNGFPYLE